MPLDTSWKRDFEDDPVGTVDHYMYINNLYVFLSTDAKLPAGEVGVMTLYTAQTGLLTRILRARGIEEVVAGTREPEVPREGR